MKQGFMVDMESATRGNSHFRKVLFTGPHAQLVVMSLKPGEDIGVETHDTLDQFIRLDGGSGKAVIGGKEYALKNGSAIVVPAGSEHNVIAGPKGMKLYAVYTTPNHPDKVIDDTKEDAVKREESAMTKSRCILALVPGSERLEKAATLSKVGGKHAASLSTVSPKLKTPCQTEGHEERMKLAKMVAARMLKPKVVSAKDHTDTPVADHKGRKPGGKALKTVTHK